MSENKCNNNNMQYKVEHMLREKVLHIKCNYYMLSAIENKFVIF